MLCFPWNQSGPTGRGGPSAWQGTSASPETPGPRYTFQLAPSRTLQPGRHAAPAYPGKQTCSGGPHTAGSFSEVVWGSGTKPAPLHVTHLQPALHPALVRTVELTTLSPTHEEGSSDTGPVSSQVTVLFCPLQDLLAPQQEHRPSTEGIFWLEDSQYTSWAIQKSLESRAEVYLESQLEDLLATILKVNSANQEPSNSCPCQC